MGRRGGRAPLRPLERTWMFVCIHSTRGPGRRRHANERLCEPGGLADAMHSEGMTFKMAGDGHPVRRCEGRRRRRALPKVTSAGGSSSATGSSRPRSATPSRRAPTSTRRGGHGRDRGAPRARVLQEPRARRLRRSRPVHGARRVPRYPRERAHVFGSARSRRPGRSRPGCGRRRSAARRAARRGRGAGRGHRHRRGARARSRIGSAPRPSPRRARSSVECDVYAPCALGGTVNAETIPAPLQDRRGLRQQPARGDRGRRAPPAAASSMRPTT